MSAFWVDIVVLVALLTALVVVRIVGFNSEVENPVNYRSSSVLLGFSAIDKFVTTVSTIIGVGVGLSFCWGWPSVVSCGTRGFVVGGTSGFAEFLVPSSQSLSSLSTDIFFVVE